MTELANWQAHLKLCHRQSDSLKNRVALFNSTAGKYTSMQVAREPEHGRASKAEGQKCLSF